MTNQFVYIVGPPGVGKYTIANKLAAKMPAKLVDNHYWLNPVFGMIQQDGITPIPKDVWNQVKQVRAAIMETIATHSPSDWNFVFTLAFVNNSRDIEIAKELLEIADRREADALVVRLTCAPDELARRVVVPERRLRFKDADPEAALRNATLPLFDAGSRKAITIDTTSLSADETVERILQVL